VFLVNVPIAVIALVFGWFLVPESRDPSASSLDLPGATLSIGAVGALVYGIIEAPSKGWTSTEILVSFAIAAVLGAIFAWRETHTDEPMLDLALFRDRRFSGGALAIALTLFALAVCMANVMAPSTGSVMSAVPAAKAGVGSAMNDLLRQLGGALGIAIIGSVMNTVYRDRMTDAAAAAGVPPQAAALVTDS